MTTNLFLDTVARELVRVYAPEVMDALLKSDMNPKRRMLLPTNEIKVQEPNWDGLETIEFRFDNDKYVEITTLIQTLNLDAMPLPLASKLKLF
jgi:hypothetical protein